MPTGVSKLGGSPDLPTSVEWPSWKGKPLSFIAQLRLPDATEYDSEGVLPRSGMLYFFYNAEQDTWGFDLSDRGSWRVLYFDAHPDTLMRTNPPSTINRHGIFIPCGLTFFTELVLPPWDSAEIDGLDLTKEEQDSYGPLMDHIRELHTIEVGTLHRLLGYPDQIQNPMPLECQLVSHGVGYNDPKAASLAAGAIDWRLLLQIDSDDNANMTWGDVGSIYFWIRQEDLRIRNFDSTWMILQCH